MPRYIVSTPSELDSYIYVEDTKTGLKLRVDYADEPDAQERIRSELYALLSCRRFEARGPAPEYL